MKLEDIGFYTLSDERAENSGINSPLWRCELLLTNRCNFNCKYCRGTQEDANITYEHAKYIVDLWCNEGLKNIRFSGGEPTLVKWLPELIKYTKNKPSIERIAISTNGSQKTSYYIKLKKLGVNDFSISLDACCESFADKMSGTSGYFQQIINNIQILSRLTYVTVGCVFDKNNIQQSLETIELAHKLGVADIRIISSAQSNEMLEFCEKIPDEILNSHPILKYRVNNYKNGRNVRGIQKTDNHKCPLILDDMAIRGNYHYPCIIKMREGCEPIGEVGCFMRAQRFDYYIKHNCYKDEICRNNCLDVCIDYNNRHKNFKE